MIFSGARDVPCVCAWEARAVTAPFLFDHRCNYVTSVNPELGTTLARLDQSRVCAVLQPNSSA